MNWFKKHRIDDLDVKIPRDDLLQRSRILIIDDERPDLIDDLRQAGFAVDYETDITNANMGKIERIKYDLIILDFANVGKAFGDDEGLSLLKHIKRVNPTAIIFAYTSKMLGAQHADFFRLADGVLSKDAGIHESTERIEDGLQRARSVQNLWKGILSVANVQPGSSEDLALQDLYVRGLTNKGKRDSLTSKVMKVVAGENGQRIAQFIIDRLIEAGSNKSGDK